LEGTAGKKTVYRVAKQMAKSGQDVVRVNCVKDANGKVLEELMIKWRDGESILRN